MKRSQSIRLILLGGLTSAVLTGCDQKPSVHSQNFYTNNFFVPGAGYYHAPFRGWFALPYNHFDAQKQMYFYGGQWGALPFESVTNISPPTTEAVQVAQSTRTDVTRGGFGGFSRGFSSGGWSGVSFVMKRHACHPRADWRDKVESFGLTYHSHDHGPYWDESACYELTRAEVDELESAANTLHFLCIDAAEAVINNNWWPRLGISDAAVPAILQSWERDDFSLYGRFDFAFDGITPPKLLEYNADTPTALVEAAVAQWFWLEELHPRADQFNSIHERLITAWKRFAGETIHFSCVKELAEDEMTVLYLRDTAEQAGVKTKSVFIDDIGWHTRENGFVDLDNERIRRAFKLYPWEWLWHEEFGAHLAKECVQLIEPAWKMLLSNKGLLPVLWELFPGQPNLLPAYDAAGPLGDRYVRKPKLSREGSNVSWIENGVVVEENGGNYGEEGFVFQSPASLPDFGGNHPVFGVWVIDHEAAGLGIREDTRRITGNLSRFMPHFFT